MSLIVRHSESDAAPITPLEDGVHNAVCIGIFDVGYQFSEKFNTTSRKAVLFFEVEATIEDEGAFKGKRYTVNREFTLSTSPKSTLRKTLDAWIGGIDDKIADFKEKNGYEGLDFEELLIGQPALVQTQQNVSQAGKTYSNIVSITKLPKKTAILEIENKDYEAPKFVQDRLARAVDKAETKQISV